MTDTFTSIGHAAAGVVRGLTAKQHAARKGKLTASRVACLMTGDAAKIYRLWLEMTGQAEPEDLSGVWAVQRGIATESLNLDWAEKKVGEQVIDRGEFLQHPRLEWAGATIDGMFRESERPVDAKDIGGREPLETVLDRYQPQMQWIMECASWRPSECALSIIIGGNEPIIEWIPRDDEYAFEMVRRGQQFMQHVRNRTQPVELSPVPPPVIPVKKYDMHGNNAWGSNAAIWITNLQASRDFHHADKDLRALVPADAKECSGYGVIAKRDRAGRISIREQQS